MDNPDHHLGPVWQVEGERVDVNRARELADGFMAEAEDGRRIGGQTGAPGSGNRQMPPTLWTVILTARDCQSPDAQVALARLCQVYWFPLFAFVRRQGYDHHQAQDLTQGFFEHLFERAWLEGIDKQKGRFRTFLLCALSNFLVNEREKHLSLKRGGAIQQFVSWDFELAESRLGEAPATGANPGIEFDRLWACALVEKALAALEQEYSRCGKRELFQTLSPFMTGPVPAGFYADAATKSHMTEGALRIAMHRLLQRFGELLRAEVVNTVADSEDVDEELREVLKAWGQQ